MANKRGGFLTWVEVVGLYAVITLPLLLRYPPIWPDEALFASPSESLARGEGMGTVVLAGFIPGMDRYTYWLPPGYFITLAALFRLFGPAHHLLLMRLLSWLLGVALLGISWIILKRLTAHSWIVWPSLILLATHATFIRAANLGRMEMLTLLCALGGAAVYLQFLQRDESRWLAGAGFLSGLACLYHPGGVVILVALALHQWLRRGFRVLVRRETYIFLASVFVPLLSWLVYILQAPHFFLLQFAGQLVRKTSNTGTVLARETAIAWLLRPWRIPQWGPLVRWPLEDYFSLFIFLVAVLLLILPAREKVEASVLGLWVLAGFALNLFTLESWYPIYFVLPMILTLGWGAATTPYRWARALGLLALFVGMGWNTTQIVPLLRGPYGGWSDYQAYASAIAAQIPRGSSILLVAIPDPYFGLQAEPKAYRLYEFAPEGIPVDPRRAEQALASIDYVVDSGCCNPAYLRQYLKSYGALAGAATSPTRTAPSVRIWKLRRP